MRVSTAQMFLQSTKHMTTNESKLNDQSAYLATGKKVLTAKDNGVQYGTLIGYKDELQSIELYRRNITQATNRNSLSEVQFSSAQNVLNQIKTTFIQANNGAMSDDDRDALSEQLMQNLEQMLDIANAKDETGGYVFSGYQIDVKPFELQPDNSVNYMGDNGVRELKISRSVAVPLNQPGDDAFEKVENRLGDFSATYNTNTSGASVNKAVISDRGVYVDNAPYTLDFTDVDTDGNLELTITDGVATTVTFDPYVPGQTYGFPGMEVSLEGIPNVGDQVTLNPEPNISIFQTIKEAIDWVNVKSPANGTEKHKTEYGHILSQINASLNHISTRQGDAGINLQLLQTQSTYHQDNELLMEQGRSSIEDLDYAAAVTEFEQAKVALQAAQQTYVKVQNLSLFNFI
ncbi:flagellar hook-associated protein FlgL [Thalassotalea sp. M1531]|uniref:Flagellar hook-associated protein FlgL n=1 Tax=Thalassotalea algicola TaxID=2716224 RepID=A0A7Y0Q7Y8_9GAMM|nr:flagellar hook-associated protein FlgL [Thalassotalea algicola]NMP32883.1 flagellar hook-associated protein FlgL [Thalassotalea algicola]